MNEEQLKGLIRSHEIRKILLEMQYVALMNAMILQIENEVFNR